MFCLSCESNFQSLEDFKKAVASGVTPFSAKAVVAAGGASDTTSSSSGASVENSRLELLQGLVRDLVGKQFAIPDDESTKPEGPVGENTRSKKKGRKPRQCPAPVVFQVANVAWARIEDQENPTGYSELIANYYPVEVGDVEEGPNGGEYEWSKASEVQQWVEVFREENGASVKPASQNVSAGTKRQKQSAASAHTSLPLTRLQKALQEKSARLLNRGVRLAALASASGDRKDEFSESDGEDEDGESSRGGGGGAGSGGSGNGGGRGGGGVGNRIMRLGFVFDRIVSSARMTGGETSYTCEYKTEVGVQKLCHSAGEVSSVAVAEFRQRLLLGSFEYGAEEAKLRRDMCGSNDKEKQSLLKKRSHSAGICAGVTNCGIVVDVYELLGAEGCSQVTETGFFFVWYLFWYFVRTD